MITEVVEYIPYGFCASKKCICPIGITGLCGINGNYYECKEFRKAGQQRALKEIDSNGQVRIHLANSQGVIERPGHCERLRDNSQVQEVFNH